MARFRDPDITRRVRDAVPESWARTSMIISALRMNKNTVRNYLEYLLKKGLVECEVKGARNLYWRAVTVQQNSAHAGRY